MNRDVRTIEILGTTYDISYVAQDNMNELMGSDEYTGCCDGDLKKIMISTLDNDATISEEKRIAMMSLNLRHEIIHAFLNESGLSWDAMGCDNWPKNEEMVGWLAVQLPKVYRVYASLDIL